jgi:peptidoglycan LD-endopeptidase CwlK
MAYKLSATSLKKLRGVKEDLCEVIEAAILHSTIDFGVLEGLRTVERQRQLVAKGASQTMKSKHITGDAVDLGAYIGGHIDWTASLYDNIADAVKAAAQELDVSVKWGGAWNVENIAEWDGTMQDASDFYIRTRRAEGKKPFMDLGHFELSKF